MVSRIRKVSLRFKVVIFFVIIANRTMNFSFKWLLSVSGWETACYTKMANAILRIIEVGTVLCGESNALLSTYIHARVPGSISQVTPASK